MMAEGATGPTPDERLTRVSLAMCDFLVGAADTLGDPVLAATLTIRVGAAGLSIAQDRNKSAAALIAEAMAVLQTESKDAAARQAIIDRLKSIGGST